MQQCDTLIQPGWCIPVEPAGVVLQDHCIAVSDGRIVELLPATEAQQKYSAGVTIRRPGQVLIPGLVNAHTHAAMTLFRGLADDLPLETWLQEVIWPAEKRWVSAELVRDGTRHAIAEMLLSGVTCFSDQYFFPEIVAETAVEMHMRAMIGTPVIEFPTAWSDNASDCLVKGSDLVHDRFADHPLISSCFAPHSVDTVTDRSFCEMRVVADQLDKRVQIHLHESLAEIQLSLKSSGKRPIERLHDLGIVNASLMAVHAVHLSEAEIALFANSGVTVAHCPRSNLKLADGIAPVAKLQAAGVTVALGTDGAASNNELDLLGEMRTAALLAKAAAGDASALPAATALRMATLDSARSIGLEDSIGSIERGKSADLTCVDLRRLNSQPLYDPLSQLVYTAARDQVRDVWVAGKQLLDNGTPVHINIDRLLERSDEWRQRIARD